MKRILLIATLLIVLCNVAIAESVTRMDCTIIIEGAERIGKYTGDIVDGVPHGFGIFENETSAANAWHYIGEWENGVFSGHGSTYWPDGYVQTGIYKDFAFVSGNIYPAQDYYYTILADSTDHDCNNAIYYRKDGSVIYEGCIYKGFNRAHIGTFYDKNGNVLLSGTFDLFFDAEELYTLEDDGGNYEYMDYASLARNPERYIGKGIRISGNVIQATGSRSEGYYLRVTDGGTNNVYMAITDDESAPEYNILEGDTVIVNGVFGGDYSYTSTMGKQVTIPCIYCTSIIVVGLN